MRPEEQCFRQREQQVPRCSNKCGVLEDSGQSLPLPFALLHCTSSAAVSLLLYTSILPLGSETPQGEGLCVSLLHSLRHTALVG